MTWSLDDLKQSLRILKIGRGSKLFVHSNLAFLGRQIGQEDNPASVILEFLESLVTSSGAIYVPAFTYTHGDSEVFEPYRAVGLESMGALSVAAFKRGYMRSIDPMFSMLGFGALTKNFVRPLRNCSFGDGSLFGQLVNENITLLLIGTGGGTTLLHEIERRKHVYYRFDKTFLCKVRTTEQDDVRYIAWESYVRDLSSRQTTADFRLLTKDLVQRGIASISRLGKASLLSYSITDVSNFVFEQLNSNEDYLIRKGWENCNLKKDQPL
jgi:aminoglycoside N3'-acetyltransferase